MWSNNKSIDENKKKLVLETLQKLIGVWDLAEWLYNLVDSEYLTNELLDNLIEQINNSVKNIKDKDKLEQIKKWLNKIKQIKIEEKKENSNKSDALLNDLYNM